MTRTDPLQRQEHFTDDNNGNLKTFTDRKSQATTFTYDALNRLTQVSDSVNGAITHGYDNLDLLTSEVTPQGTVSYVNDVAGRRTTHSCTATVLGQPAVTYAYDNANRLLQISQGASTVTMSYDNAGRLNPLTLPNGVVVSYGYDAASRLVSINYDQGTTHLGHLAYQYDAAGRRTRMSGSSARANLPAAVTSASYDAANELTQWGAATLSYDADGNLANDGTNLYAWNARNQLVSMGAATFAYDGFSRRTLNGAGTSFLYDGVNPVQELSGATVTANQLTGGVEQIFTHTDSNGTSNFLTDALGSTLALTDSSGVVQTSN